VSSREIDWEWEAIEVERWGLYAAIDNERWIEEQRADEDGERRLEEVVDSFEFELDDDPTPERWQLETDRD